MKIKREINKIEIDKGIPCGQWFGRHHDRGQGPCWGHDWSSHWSPESITSINKVIKSKKVRFEYLGIDHQELSLLWSYHQAHGNWPQIQNGVHSIIILLIHILTLFFFFLFLIIPNNISFLHCKNLSSFLIIITVAHSQSVDSLEKVSLLKYNFSLLEDFLVLHCLVQMLCSSTNLHLCKIKYKNDEKR